MANPQPQFGLVAQFAFEGNVENLAGTPLEGTLAGNPSFSEGLQGQALRLEADDGSVFFSIPAEALPVGVDQDFSVQFWMRTEAESSTTVRASCRPRSIPQNNVPAQRGSGWTFYTSYGTWAWTMGSGSRRITYERENGSRMPLNDGQWHQLTMTYSSALSEVRLFYDGVNWVTYNVRRFGRVRLHRPRPPHRRMGGNRNPAPSGDTPGNRGWCRPTSGAGGRLQRPGIERGSTRRVHAADRRTSAPVRGQGLRGRCPASGPTARPFVRPWRQWTGSRWRTRSPL